LRRRVLLHRNFENPALPVPDLQRFRRYRLRRRVRIVAEKAFSIGRLPTAKSGRSTVCMSCSKRLQCCHGDPRKRDEPNQSTMKTLLAELDGNLVLRQPLGPPVPRSRSPTADLAEPSGRLPSLDEYRSHVFFGRQTIPVRRGSETPVETSNALEDCDSSRPPQIGGFPQAGALEEVCLCTC